MNAKEIVGSGPPGKAVIVLSGTDLLQEQNARKENRFAAMIDQQKEKERDRSAVVRDPQELEEAIADLPGRSRRTIVAFREANALQQETAAMKSVPIDQHDHSRVHPCPSTRTIGNLSANLMRNVPIDQPALSRVHNHLSARTIRNLLASAMRIVPIDPPGHSKALNGLSPRMNGNPLTNAMRKAPRGQCVQGKD
jgi:hypothetical protein